MLGMRTRLLINKGTQLNAKEDLSVLTNLCEVDLPKGKHSKCFEKYSRPFL